MATSTKSPQNSKFRNFLGMSFFFKQEIQTPVTQEFIEQRQNELKLRKELDNKVDSLILEKDELKIEIILDRGYELNYSQVYSILRAKLSSEKIKEHTFEVYDTKIKYEVVEKLNNLAKGVELEDKTRIESYQFNPYVTQASYLAQTTYTFWNYFKKEKLLSDKDYNLLFIDACQNAKQKLSFYVNTYDAKNYLGIEVLSLLMQNIDEYLDVIKKDSSPDNLNRFDAILNIKMHKIPQETQDIIKDIHKLYDEISNETLTIEQNLDTYNFYKKRLPQILLKNGR